jgi:predicted Zn-dependent protease with MMP-like domain
MFDASRRDDLCGLHTGVPLTEKRHMGDTWRIPDPSAVTIYREGIMRMAYDIRGRLTEKELLRQIRITLLHEIGHHHGLDEDDLEELGYG